VGSILVNHAVLENGLTQEIAVVKIVLVLTLLDAKHAQRQPLVALVRLDMKVITLEDAEYVMKEHILQPVDLVFLVLLVNGRSLEVISVKNVLKLMDVMLVVRLTPVPLVLLDSRLMEMEDVMLVMRGITQLQTAPLVLFVQMANTLTQDQVLAPPVQAIVKLVLRLLSVVAVTLDMAILRDIVVLALVELIQQAELALVKHAPLVPGLTQQIIAVNLVSILLDAKHVIQHPLVLCVLQDIRVMESEGVLLAMKEHILQLVALVLLVLMANGQILQVLVVQIVLM